MLVVVGGVVFLYMVHRQPALLGQVVEGINRIADDLQEGERQKSAARLRELSDILKAHGSDLDRYGAEVDQKLAEIRQQSEAAYQAAKKKVDEYRGSKTSGTPQEPAKR